MIKLSEAIRKGATLRPRVRGGYFKRVGKSKEIRSCALGAAYEGATGQVLVGNPKEVTEKLAELFPELKERVQEGYLGGKPSPAQWDLGRLIMAEHDARGKTREQIADALEAKGR